MTLRGGLGKQTKSRRHPHRHPTPSASIGYGGYGRSSGYGGRFGGAPPARPRGRSRSSHRQSIHPQYGGSAAYTSM
eukprot:3663692-Prymnesium_polylepis.1